MVFMLLDLPDEETRPRFGAHWPWCVAVGVAFIVAVDFWGLWSPQGSELVPAAVGVATGGQQGNLAAIGMTLFGRFALPFELVSLLLLAAIVGALVLARDRRPLSPPSGVRNPDPVLATDGVPGGRAAS
jgi:NADH-quinone oxidoreductase subunit J